MTTLEDDYTPINNAVKSVADRVTVLENKGNPFTTYISNGVSNTNYFTYNPSTKAITVNQDVRFDIFMNCQLSTHFVFAGVYYAAGTFNQFIIGGARHGNDRQMVGIRHNGSNLVMCLNGSTTVVQLIGQYDSMPTDNYARYRVYAR